MIIIVRIVFVEYNDINLDFDVCGDDHDQIVSWGKLSDNREYFTLGDFPMSTNDFTTKIMETTLMIVGCGSGTGWGTLDPGGAVVP